MDRFISHQDLSQLRELFLKAEVARVQAALSERNLEVHIGRVYLKNGLCETDSIDKETGRITSKIEPPKIEPPKIEPPKIEQIEQTEPAHASRENFRDSSGRPRGVLIGAEVGQ